MEELIKLVPKQTGFPEEMAEQLLEVVPGCLEKRLPGPLCGVVDMS
jgi:hypothetical protein